MEESDLGEAQQVLSHHYFDFEFAVDLGVLKQILSDQPDLTERAKRWGWSDTEVREELVREVAAFYGQTWEAYSSGENHHVQRAVAAAQEKYLEERSS